MEDGTYKRKMRFCGDCGNMMFPSEFVDLKTLQHLLTFECKFCPQSAIVVPEDAHLSEFILHETVYNKASSSDVTIREDISSDPTRAVMDVTCPKCNFEKAITVQSNAPDQMTLYYICCNPECKNRWQPD